MFKIGVVAVSFFALSITANSETLGTHSTGTTGTSSAKASGNLDYCGQTAVDAYSKSRQTKELIETLHIYTKVSPAYFRKKSEENSNGPADDDRTPDEKREALSKEPKSSTGYSYMYVKQALLRSSLTEKRLEGTLAKDSGPELEKQGFVNLMKCSDWASKIKKPSDAPNGALIVLSPLKKGRNLGTIAVRSKYGCDSDFVNGSCDFGDRKILGIYIKPVFEPQPQPMPPMESRPAGGA